MKKLNFKKLNIEQADVLTSLQMKKIVGGHEPITVYCYVVCLSGHDYQLNGPVADCEQAYANAANLCMYEEPPGVYSCCCECP